MAIRLTVIAILLVGSGSAQVSDELLPPRDLSRSTVRATGSTAYRTNADRWGDVINVKDFGAIGDGKTPSKDAVAIQAALDAASIRAHKAVVYVPPGEYVTDRPLTIPEGVTLAGQVNGWTNIPGTALLRGATIVKAHGGNAIEIAVAGQILGAEVRDLAIRSDRKAYPTGHGIVIGKGVEVRLARVNIFTPGGDGFVIGDGSADAFHNYAEDCYVNNPGARGFVIASLWFRGRTLKTDGGTIGIELAQYAAHWTLDAFHVEGFTVAGVKAGGGFGTTVGYSVVANTSNPPAAIGIDVPNVIGAFIQTWRGVHFFGSNNFAGSRGIRTNGVQNTHIRVTECTFENEERAVEINSNDATVEGNVFYGNGRALKVNAGNLVFQRNRVEATVDVASAEYVAGANERVADNYLDKPLGVPSVPLSPLGLDGLPQAGKIFMGNGEPLDALGNDGDFYYRTDAPSPEAVWQGAKQRIYVKSAGVWSGIL